MTHLRSLGSLQTWNILTRVSAIRQTSLCLIFWRPDPAVDSLPNPTLDPSLGALEQDWGSASFAPLPRVGQILLENGAS